MGQVEGGGGTRERGEGETGKGRQRDFPNAFQPTELNVIMHGEDFIIGRWNSLKLAESGSSTSPPPPFASLRYPSKGLVTSPTLEQFSSLH